MTTTTPEAVAGERPDLKFWKLLSAGFVHAILFVGGPYLLQRLDLITPLKPKAYLVLILTWVGLALKLLVGDVASDKFEYHKHGYDFCILTMGTALSMLSLQMLSRRDLLSGLPNTGPLAVLADLSPDIVTQRIILLATLFLVTCVLALFTARASRAISLEKSKAPNVLAVFNFFVGATTFAAYLFLLLSKGE